LGAEEGLRLRQGESGAGDERRSINRGKKEVARRRNSARASAPGEGGLGGGVLCRGLGGGSRGSLEGLRFLQDTMNQDEGEENWRTEHFLNAGQDLPDEKEKGKCTGKLAGLREEEPRLEREDA